MEKYLVKKIQPFDPSKARTVEDVLVGLQGCSFQGRNLGQALEVLTNMVKEKCFRVLTLAGAMIPAGMEEIICQLIEKKIIHAVVSTGANIIHSIINVLEPKDHMVHYIGSPHVDDRELNKYAIDRVYDTFLREPDYWVAEDFILEKLVHDFGKGTQVIMTQSEFYSWLAKHLPGRSFVKVAADNGVPVFNPAFSDSELGLDLARYRKFHDVKIIIDDVGDIDKFAQLLMKYKRFGTIILGGGVPRNWAQQVFPYIENIVQRRGDLVDGEAYTGYHYSVRFHTAVPEDGGLSGCTISESISWGKYQHDAKWASVWVDSTIAFPIVVTALFQRMERLELQP
ncbi:MAG: deoxyhypusine synthase family protein [Candidatus Lokiarchaeota archaeon]|nr:deoxyhypusine synthase family protein [Candidatus Lokiarchaeota archaeon]